jgi:hypothetical protein
LIDNSLERGGGKRVLAKLEIFDNPVLGGEERA